MSEQALAIGRSRGSRWVNAVSIAALTVPIFVVDVFTDWAIAVAVLYVVPVLLSLRLLSRRRVIWLAVGCCALTALGSPLARYGSMEAGMVNVAISLTAILTTTYLGLRMLGHEAASHEARAHLFRLSRIGNLGELAASIAHEVNQPLAALSSSAGACRRWLEADPPDLDRARRSLDRIAGEAARAAEVIAGVRRLSARRAATSTRVAMAEVIAGSVSVAAAEMARHDISLRLDVADDLPEPKVDRVQIQQVLINLLLNAIESLAAHDRDGREIRLSCHRSGEWLSITAADNGPGLSREAEQHLWEPFWTDREGGTGLGLTMSRAIAEAHRGTLDWRRGDTSGAVFELRLPTDQGGAHGGR